MSRTIFLYALLVCLLIAGCAPSAAPELLNTPTAKAPISSKPPALEGSWRIRMSYSGGIMGLSRSIDIASDGKYTVTDEKTNKAIMGELTADVLSELTQQVIALNSIPANKTDRAGCADCFSYDLEIQRNGEKFTVQLNDAGMQNSEIESLIANLRGMIDTALK